MSSKKNLPTQVLAQLQLAEIMHSDLMFQDAYLLLTNQSALFSKAHNIVVTLHYDSFMTSAPGLATMKFGVRSMLGYSATKIVLC